LRTRKCGETESAGRAVLLRSGQEDRSAVRAWSSASSHDRHRGRLGGFDPRQAGVGCGWRPGPFRPERWRPGDTGDGLAPSRACPHVAGCRALPETQRVSTGAEHDHGDVRRPVAHDKEIEDWPPMSRLGGSGPSAGVRADRMPSAAPSSGQGGEELRFRLVRDSCQSSGASLGA